MKLCKPKRRRGRNSKPIKIKKRKRRRRSRRLKYLKRVMKKIMVRVSMDGEVNKNKMKMMKT
jgi:hypothetical protein